MMRLLVARAGERKGLGAIFKELGSADAAGCSIVNTALKELIGNAIPNPPPSGEKYEKALKAWQQQAVQWWTEHENKLKHNPDPQAHDSNSKILHANRMSFPCFAQIRQKTVTCFRVFC